MTLGITWNQTIKLAIKLNQKITSIADYGAFIELAKGVEGLIHTSEMSWVNKNVNPNSILEVGQEVEVLILEVDNAKEGLVWVLNNAQITHGRNFQKVKK